MSRPAALRKNDQVAGGATEGQSVYLFPSRTDGHRPPHSHYLLNFARVEVWGSDTDSRISLGSADGVVRSGTCNEINEDLCARGVRAQDEM